MKYCRSNDLNEQGGVMILAAVLLALIFVILAFAVDLGRFALSQVEHKRTAALSGLGAMSVFWRRALDPDTSNGHTVKVALTRAVSVVKNLSEYSENIPIYAELDDHERKIVISNDPEFYPDDDVGGLIRYGVWYYREPAGGCTSAHLGQCPCPGGKWKSPCFQSSRGVGATRPATALQVEIFTPRTQKFRWVFLPVVGSWTTGIRARATVSMPADFEIISGPRIVESISLPPYPDTPDSTKRSVLSSTSRVTQRSAKTLAHRPPQSSRNSRENETEIETENDPEVCESGQVLFDQPGVYELVPESGCKSLTVAAWGAGGAASSEFHGGAGGFATATFDIRQDRIFRVVVGSGGLSPCGPDFNEVTAFGGGGSSLLDVGQGGGYSGLFAGPNPVVLAGGGGAGGWTPTECHGGSSGGAGGGKAGEDGSAPACVDRPARGGGSDVGGIGANGGGRSDGTWLQGGPGGGGGGRYGGGGTAPSFGGAGGGSGFLARYTYDPELKKGSGRVPPRQDHPSHVQPAGEGGIAGCGSMTVHGQPGLVAISW